MTYSYMSFSDYSPFGKLYISNTYIWIKIHPSVNISCVCVCVCVNICTVLYTDLYNLTFFDFIVYCIPSESIIAGSRDRKSLQKYWRGSIVSFHVMKIRDTQWNRFVDCLSNMIKCLSEKAFKERFIVKLFCDSTFVSSVWVVASVCVIEGKFSNSRRSSASLIFWFHFIIV